MNMTRLRSLCARSYILSPNSNLSKRLIPRIRIFFFVFWPFTVPLRHEFVVSRLLVFVFGRFHFRSKGLVKYIFASLLSKKGVGVMMGGKKFHVSVVRSRKDRCVDVGGVRDGHPPKVICFEYIILIVTLVYNSLIYIFSRNTTPLYNQINIYTREKLLPQNYIRSAYYGFTSNRI